MAEFLEDLEPSTIAEVIEDNAIEGCRAWACWPALALHEAPDMMWTISDIRFPLFNNILRTKIAPGQVEARIDEVLGWARARRVPIIWWIGPSSQPSDLPERLQDRGFMFAGGTTGMAVELLSLQQPKLPHPPGLYITEAVDRKQLATWNAIMTEVYEFPRFTRKHWLDMHAAMGLGVGNPWRHYVATLKGKPVATASLYCGDRAASIANVGTLVHARRKGIGTAISLAPLREAHRMGYRVATLCASQMGEGVYRRLGFRGFSRMGGYIWGE